MVVSPLCSPLTHHHGNVRSAGNRVREFIGEELITHFRTASYVRLDMIFEPRDWDRTVRRRWSARLACPAGALPGFLAAPVRNHPCIPLDQKTP